MKLVIDIPTEHYNGIVYDDAGLGHLRQIIKEATPLGEVLEDIENGTQATNSKDAYSTGMRNGMKWVKSLLDGKEPKFDDCKEPSIKEVLEDIKAEINRKANSGQWSEATVYGMQKALTIIDKHISGKE